MDPTVSLTEIQCVTRVSLVSGTGDGETTSVECNNGEILTSCGYNSESYHDKLNRPGTQVLNSAKTGEAASCVAENMNGGLGVRAHARCCTFAEAVGDVSCIGVTGGDYYSGGDTWISCNDTSRQYLLGCYAYSTTNSMVGSYASYIPPVKYTEYI